ncbi:MAG: long-chain fatty acid--CoA ligase [Polyangiaceae bacterium]
MGSLPDFTTLVDIFHHSVGRYGARDLFGTKRGGIWSWMTYAEFGRAVDRLRAGLASLGIRRGECVAIVSNNRVEWAVSAYACYGLGAVFVPMYEAQSAAEWEFIVGESEATALIVANVASLEKAKRQLAATERLRHIVVIDAEVGSQPDDPRCTTYSALLDSQSTAPAIQPASGDLATLIYTSGTTGNPKGVMLTHGNIASNVAAIHQVLKLDASDRSLAFLPWAHVFGQTAELHHLFSAGASMAICEGPDKILDNLAEIRPTLFFSVPAVFNKLFTAVQQQLASKSGLVRRLVSGALEVAARKRSGAELKIHERALLLVAERLVFAKVRARFGGRLRYASAGGAALSREVAEFIDTLGILVFEGYGLTETSPVVSTNYPGFRKMGTVGPALPGVRVVIDPEAVQGGAPGNASSAEGEIIVFGPNVMKGYFKHPEETAAVLTADGGFRTGDMGCLDAQGFLSITGRIKEQYKLENGKYVVPTALEEQLKLSPFVSNVMVYGDNRPYNVALIVANVAALRRWADDRPDPLPTEADRLLADERVRALVRGEIDRVGAGFKGFEAIRDFALIGEAFTTENGLLTPKLSLRRRKAIERYKDVIDRLYIRDARAVAASASAA